jgi:hypothetical protein
MKSAALVLTCAMGLTACAGTASDSVHPFFEPNLNRMVCCAAEAKNSKDINTLSLDVSTTAEGVVTAHFQETGVGASAPMTAQSKSVSAVSQAVSDTAISAAKILSH